MPRHRLTSLDESFLEVESRTAHMHVGWASTFAPPERGAPPSFEQIRAHVASRLARAPRYRQKLAEVPFDLNAPVWVDDPGFRVERHIHRARTSDLHELADQVMSRQLARDRPLWELWIADLGEGRIGTVGKVHHCMVDGVAAVELAALTLDPVPEPPPPEDDGWTADAQPSARRLLAEGALDRATNAARLARVPLGLARNPAGGLEMAVRSLRAARHSLTPAPPSLLNRTISSRRHLAMARRPLEALKEVKRMHRTTVNDVLLAAAAGGMRRLFERRGERPVRLKAMVPVSVREDGTADELGNRISFVFVDLPCDEPEAASRLADVHAAMNRRKLAGEPEGADTLLGAADHAPRTVQRVISRLVSGPRAFNLVVSNIPGPDAPLYMLGCLLEEAYPVVPLADQHAVSIGMTSVRGQACFGIYADPRTLVDADELADAVGEAVDELRESKERVRAVTEVDREVDHAYDE